MEDRTHQIKAEDLATKEEHAGKLSPAHNTPLELAINNEADRFSLAIDAIDRLPRLERIGLHAKEECRNRQVACRRYAYEHGIDAPEITGWRWPQ